MLVISQVHFRPDWWKEDHLRTTNVGFHLVISPVIEEQTPKIVVVIATGERKVRKEFSFVGHPEILGPRAAKQALTCCDCICSATRESRPIIQRRLSVSFVIGAFSNRCPTAIDRQYGSGDIRRFVAGQE